MKNKTFWVSALMTSFVMTLSMSGILVLINNGYSPEFFQIWINNAVTAWPVAMLLNLLILPHIMAFAVKVCPPA